MSTDNRALRVGAQVKQEIAQLLSRTFMDPRLAELSVTNVAMSGDLRLARIFWRLVSVASGPELEAKRADAEAALQASSRRLRREVTARLGLRFAPELRFSYDEGQDARDRIEQLLHEVNVERASSSRGKREP